MSPRRQWVVAFALSSIPLLGWWLYGLFDLDEGFYGAVVAEMNRRGEWITPYYNGQPWFEKPILLYWLAKPCVLIFGSAIGPRLPSVLATLGLYFVCAAFIRRRVSGQAGLWTVVVLGTTVLIVALGRMMMTDAILSLCLTAAFLSFYESLVGSTNWRVLTAACLGLAVLAKGPVALPLFVALAIWTYCAEPNLRPAFKGRWVLGTLALAAVIACWYLPAYLENGQVFVQKFIVEQNLQRFGGGDEAHRVPLVLWPIYYPAILFVGMLPWSVHLVKKVPASLSTSSEPLLRYLARWAIVVVVFFTISGTKLPHYILPAVPPLGMLAAVWMAQVRTVSWARFAASAVGLCVALTTAFLYFYKTQGFAEVHSIASDVNKLAERQGKVRLTAFQLPRRPGQERGGLSIDETSNPSLRFYLDLDKVDLEETDNIEALASTLKGRGETEMVLTRPGRISPENERVLRAQGLKLVQAPRTVPESRYTLLEVEDSAKR